MLAWTIAFGECDGGDFDWNAMSWRKREDD
jgi:hypothetical protein